MIIERFINIYIEYRLSSNTAYAYKAIFFTSSTNIRKRFISHTYIKVHYETRYDC
jgi:hypothetical protein